PWVLSGHLDLRRRVKVVTSTADLKIALWRTRRLLRRAVPHVERVIANSEFTRREFERTYGYPRERTSVGYVGVRRSFFGNPRPTPIPGSPPRLVTACRLSEGRKNVHLVIEALAALRNEFDFRYTVIGDGILRPDLERLAERLGLGDRVDFPGFVPEADLIRRIGVSDLFVLTSSTAPDTFEGFGIVYLEANACGTPALAARTGGAAEAVREGASGFFVDEPTVPALTGALRRFLAREHRFDAEACRRFAAGFTWDRVVDHISARYREVVGEGASAIHGSMRVVRPTDAT
ncbi:MAG: glycosyltransferase family 4 protein, partial [Tepidisphaeraceae bacterium]